MIGLEIQDFRYLSDECVFMFIIDEKNKIEKLNKKV